MNRLVRSVIGAILLLSACDNPDNHNNSSTVSNAKTFEAAVCAAMTSPAVALAAIPALADAVAQPAPTVVGCCTYADGTSITIQIGDCGKGGGVNWDGSGPCDWQSDPSICCARQGGGFNTMSAKDCNTRAGMQVDASNCFGTICCADKCDGTDNPATAPTIGLWTTGTNCIAMGGSAISDSGCLGVPGNMIVAEQRR
jgi:hypothetical protein